MNRAQLHGARKGQPMVVLGALLFGWVLLRALTWSSPFAQEAPNFLISESSVAETAGANGSANNDFRLRSPVAPSGNSDTQDWLRASPVDPLIQAPLEPSCCDNSTSPDRLSGQHMSGIGKDPMTGRMAAGHALLFVSGTSDTQMPEHLMRYFNSPAPGVASGPANVPAAAPYLVPFTPEQQDQRRWSADGWVLWRDDNDSPLLSGRPSYGRSQIGAVLRYDLAPSSRNRPQLHLRGSAALEGSSEREAALGASIRPLANVPVRIAAEARVSDRAAGTEIRPAAYAVTEIPAFDLPAGLRGEVYVQGGYVGGDFATAFVDGQLRVDRDLAEAGDVQLRAGAAAWGGAQEDASRLDIGPSASVSFEMGDARGRLAADYRFRVAGDAEPASGPALTLSAGF